MLFIFPDTDEFDDDGLTKEEIRKFSEHEWEQRLSKIRPELGLKNLRREHGLSQAEMAAVMRVSRRSYIDYEHGEKAIPSSALVYLKATYDCDLNRLFERFSIPLSEKDSRTYVSKAFEFVVQVSQRNKGMSLEDAKRVAGEMLTDFSDDESWGACSVDDFVEYFRTAIEVERKAASAKNRGFSKS